MKKSYAERIEAYPELKKHMEHMLDVVENLGGKADKANDAEIQIVYNMRQIGAAALQEWAVQKDKAVTEQWKKEHPTSIKHGKKKFIGELPLDNKNS